MSTQLSASQIPAHYVGGLVHNRLKRGFADPMSLLEMTGPASLDLEE